MRHYGIYVDENEPVTGVINASYPEWLDEEIFYNSIDLDLENHLIECPDCIDGSECEIIEYWDGSISTRLIGSWKKDETGQYEPDKSGEYAAVFRPDSNIVQVVWSRTIKESCNLCSPCYPGQVDLDSFGDFKGYDLPKDIWGVNYDEFHQRRR